MIPTTRRKTAVSERGPGQGPTTDLHRGCSCPSPVRDRGPKGVEVCVWKWVPETSFSSGLPEVGLEGLRGVSLVQMVSVVLRPRSVGRSPVETSPEIPVAGTGTTLTSHSGAGTGASGRRSGRDPTPSQWTFPHGSRRGWCGGGELPRFPPVPFCLRWMKGDGSLESVSLERAGVVDRSTVERVFGDLRV